MNKLAIVKAVSGFVASASVGVVVKNVIRNSGVQGNVITGIFTGIGALIISDMVAQHAVAYVETQIDETAEWLHNFDIKIKK